MAALHPDLPPELRAYLAPRIWLRAVLLGDDATERDLRALVASLDPAMRPFLERMQHAKSDDERRFALVHMLLTLPRIGLGFSSWTDGPVAAGMIVSSYYNHGWCALPATSPHHLRFSDAAARAAVNQELRKLAAFGASSTFLAGEAARLGNVFPNDPRVPEMLHLAINATRFECGDAGTRKASEAAFRVLHKRFPDNPWTKKTPYFYGN